MLETNYTRAILLDVKNRKTNANFRELVFGMSLGKIIQLFCREN